jgi:hypothetical protein
LLLYHASIHPSQHSCLLHTQSLLAFSFRPH